MKMSKLFLFCWNIYIFPFSTALRKQQKILACFPEDKLSTIYLDLQIHPPPHRLLMRRVSSGASVNVWTFFNSCVWVPQLSSVWKDGSKIIQSLLEWVQICKICWKTEASAGHGGFFWRTVIRLTIQNKQGTHEQPSQTNKQNKTEQERTVVDHPGNHTHHYIRTKGSQTFEGGYFNNFSYFYFFLSCGLYVNIFYVKYLTQDSTK